MPTTVTDVVRPTRSEVWWSTAHVLQRSTPPSSSEHPRAVTTTYPVPLGDRGTSHEPTPTTTDTTPGRRHLPPQRKSPSSVSLRQSLTYKVGSTTTSTPDRRPTFFHSAPGTRLQSFQRRSTSVEPGEVEARRGHNQSPGSSDGVEGEEGVESTKEQ